MNGCAFQSLSETPTYTNVFPYQCRVSVSTTRISSSVYESLCVSFYFSKTYPYLSPSLGIRIFGVSTETMMFAENHLLTELHDERWTCKSVINDRSYIYIYIDILYIDFNVCISFEPVCLYFIKNTGSVQCSIRCLFRNVYVRCVQVVHLRFSERIIIIVQATARAGIYRFIGH